MFRNQYYNTQNNISEKPVSLKRHKRNQSSCGGNKIIKVEAGADSGIVDNKCYSVDNRQASEWKDTKELNDTSFNVTQGNDCNEKAICLDSAYKHYGKGRKKFPVLLGLDMNVEKGTIYGLLGNYKK